MRDMIGLNEEADRCLRIARRKYDKPSAYRSGAIVRCRQGKIWKDLKESGELNEFDLNNNDELIQLAHSSITRKKGKEYAPDVHELQAWIDDYLKKNSNITEDESLHKWFSRKGESGKTGGWVDCNTCRNVDGKKKCKSCGRQKGEKRSKYPSCRPTPSACSTPGKGKKWGKTKNEGETLNEDVNIKRVALLFIVIDNKVLLFKRSSKESTNPGKYGMLGGGIEDGESPKVALKREIEEEAGITIGSFKQLKKYKYDGVELNVFYTNNFPVDDIKLKKDEHTSYKFFKLDDVMNMKDSELIPTNKDIARDYNKKVSKSKRIHEEILNMLHLINEESFMGNYVWKHLVDITPDEDNIPWGFKNKIKNADFKNVDNFNIESLLTTDPDFKEYFDSGQTRYDDDEVDPEDLNHEIIVVDGELLDGYSRVSTLLRNGVKTTNAFVGTSGL